MHPYNIFVFISNDKYFHGHIHRQAHISLNNAQIVHLTSSNYSKTNVRSWSRRRSSLQPHSFSSCAAPLLINEETPVSFLHQISVFAPHASTQSQLGLTFITFRPWGQLMSNKLREK